MVLTCEFVAFLEDEERREYNVRTDRADGRWLATVENQELRFSEPEAGYLMFIGTVNNVPVCVQSNGMICVIR